MQNMHPDLELYLNIEPWSILLSSLSLLYFSTLKKLRETSTHVWTPGMQWHSLLLWAVQCVM